MILNCPMPRQSDHGVMITPLASQIHVSTRLFRIGCSRYFVRSRRCLRGRPGATDVTCTHLYAYVYASDMYILQLVAAESRTF